MWWIIASVVLCGLCVLAVADLIQTTDPVRRIYPIVGRIPDLLRRLREIARVRDDSNGPFSDQALNQIRDRSVAGVGDWSFGASSTPYPDRAVTVALFPADSVEIDPVWCGRPESARRLLLPRVNFGALGFGPVSGRTVEAMGHAARTQDCLLNTGEDGLTPFHRKGGARLIWQLGTGYAGCRTTDGRFSESAFQEELDRTDTVAAVEVKLSQGAKPGMGGLLPANKVTRDVAAILGAMAGTAIVSPPHHSAFRDATEMLGFLDRLREISGGLPIGIKLCIGSRDATRKLVRAMVEAQTWPDFITVDGAGGGTGAGPFVLQHHAGLSLRRAVIELNAALSEGGMRDRVRVVASGGLWNGFDVLEMLAFGADACNVVRAAMVAMGCVVARECHTGRCPSGIATQQPWRIRGISPRPQGQQLARYHSSILADMEALLRAAGVSRVADFSQDHLVDISNDNLPRSDILVSPHTHAGGGSEPPEA